MNQAQLAVTEFKRFYQRRKKILILCPLLILGLSITAAYMLPSEYKSSITILVQKDETLNPMVRYNLAVALASEDRLKSFNEIIYSRSTINMLIDSLGLAEEEMSRKERDEAIEKVRSNILTSLKASDSFSITYYDTNPQRAKEAVQLLSDHFIKTKLQLENKRNNQTVEFFQQKMDELREVVEEREKEVTSNIRENVESTPRENRSLQSDLDRVEREISDLELGIKKIRNRLELVKAINSGKRDIEALHELDLSTLPSGSKLEAQLENYSEYSRKYTSSYPKIQELQEKIRNGTERLAAELESQLFDQQAQLSYLKDQSNELTKKIEQTTVGERKTQQTQLDFEVYRNLYDEMKVKLEQAKTSRDLGKEAKNQFVVIDPPIVPQEPAKPNRIMLVGGGVFMGIFLGLIAAAFAELMDTTVRRPEDLKKFNKPVVAYIPAGKE